MKKFFTLIFIIFTLFLTTILQAFTSSEGGFSIQMPGKPRLQRVNHKSAVGDVKENTYTFKTKTAEYNASFTELPDIAVSMQSDKALIGRAKEGFIKDTGAQKTDLQPVDCQGKKGEEMTYEIQNYSSVQLGKARFCIADKKLYVISAKTSSKSLKAIDQYLNSFKLLTK